MSYQSPIELFHTEPIIERIVDKCNQYIYNAVTNMDVKVDKEELEKALAYDRDQYWKGFQDGRVYTPPNPTNADYIRSLDDEKLAEWLSVAYISSAGDLLRDKGIEFEVDVWGMRNEVLEWLKQEHKE